MITVQRARELRAMIEKAAGAGLDNKDGSTAVELFPTLTGGGALVKSGTRINWKGALKRATVDLWDTAENTPEAAPNLWELISPLFFSIISFKFIFNTPFLLLSFPDFLY